MSSTIQESNHIEFTSQDFKTSQSKRIAKLMGHPLPQEMTQPHFLNADIQTLKQNGFLYEIEEDVKREFLFPIVICRCLCPASHYTKRSGWQMYQLIYTHGGKGKLYLRDHLYSLDPGSFCLLDCREYHYFFADSPDGWEYSFIHFEGPGAKLLFRAARANSVVWENMHNSHARQTYRLLMALNDYEGIDFDLRFHKLMTELMYTLIETIPSSPKEHTRLPEWLSEAQTYIFEHYDESISVDQLAAMAHLSSSQFSHRFTTFIGVSPIRYQYQIRVNQARTYLSETNIPIEQISEKVGFHNLPNFYSVFKSITESTPAKYRKNLKAPAGE